MQVEFYQDNRGDYPVKDFIKEKLSDIEKKRVLKMLERLEKEDDYKLTRYFRSRLALPIKGRNNLFEFRRFPCRIFFTLYCNICWLLHIFKKKNEGPTPAKEIEIADHRKTLIK